MDIEQQFEELAVQARENAKEMQEAAKEIWEILGLEP